MDGIAYLVSFVVPEKSVADFFISKLNFIFILIFCFVGDVTFVSLERSMRRKVQRVKKKREKLLILCSTMLVSTFPFALDVCLSLN